jgi:hypothetical protein
MIDIITAMPPQKGGFCELLGALPWKKMQPVR